MIRKCLDLTYAGHAYIPNSLTCNKIAKINENLGKQSIVSISETDPSIEICVFARIRKKSTHVMQSWMSVPCGMDNPDRLLRVNSGAEMPMALHQNGQIRARTLKNRGT
jgi:hypothetical protein